MMSTTPCFSPSTSHGFLDPLQSEPRDLEHPVSRAWRFLALGAVGLAVLASLVGWTVVENRRWRREDLPRLHTLTARLGLSDLALWTEARYARHPSQADLFSAFQDFPGAPEHFPAGSILSPPPALTDPAAFVAPTSRGRSRDDRGDRRRRDVDATREPGDIVTPARSTSGDESP